MGGPGVNPCCAVINLSLVLFFTCSVATSVAWQPPPAWILPVRLALALCAECSQVQLAMSNFTRFFVSHKGLLCVPATQGMCSCGATMPLLLALCMGLVWMLQV